ncbi:hypothetical protein [Aquipseudomonas alcaligenes]|uniref:hypothetical protein n=1 Tax=Aquipseudomonas alcaligenes TaxID=43263 RepID=UPI001659AC02|nr:hypothetical protein [Pseudomonas alcaligenes]
MNKYIFRFLFILAACPSAQAESSKHENFKVISFSQGEMREIDGNWAIYKENEELTYKANGICIFNNKAIPCMWYGYLLEYDSFGRDVNLICNDHQDSPTDFGNPSELIEKNAKEFSYTIPLKGTERTFINLQYTSAGGTNKITRSATTCSVDGKPVLKFKQSIVMERRVKI